MRRNKQTSGERIVKDIKRKTRKQYSAEEKIRIVLDGLREEESVAELCRREGISQGIYYKWSKDFLEAGKKRLAGDIEELMLERGVDVSYETVRRWVNKFGLTYAKRIKSRSESPSPIWHLDEVYTCFVNITLKP